MVDSIANFRLHIGYLFIVLAFIFVFLGLRVFLLLRFLDIVPAPQSYYLLILCGI